MNITYSARVAGMFSTKLLELPEDILVYLLTFLCVPDILSVRQTCKRFNETANLTIVWINAWETQIFRKGYPFPLTISPEAVGKCGIEAHNRSSTALSIQHMSRVELEQRTRHAYRLAKKWLYEYPVQKFLHDSTFIPLSPLLPHRDIQWVVSPSISITDVRFVRSVRCSTSNLDAGTADESILVLTVSKGIWSVITIWDVPIFLHGSDKIQPQPRKRAEWSPKGGLFAGLCLSRDSGSEADLAVSVVCEGRHEIVLFNISDAGELLPICTVPSVPMRASTLTEEDTLHIQLQTMQPMKPMTLSGHLLAMSDDTASTVIYNWKTGAFAVLEHEEDEAGVWKHDHAIQVVFAYRSILVVRARSLHLFPEPELCLASPSSLGLTDFTTAPGLHIYSPLANHSFGWVDGVSVVPVYPDPSISSQPGTLKILVRLQSDNPWTANEHSLDLYELSVNPNFVDPAFGHGESITAIQCPYLFPPICTTRVSSTRGPLRCTDLVLGQCGTAIWVKPGDRALHGLLTSDVYVDYTYIARLGGLEASGGGVTESLVAGIFPGPLNPGEEVRTRKICTNISNNWTAFDYDEAIGRLVLGDAAGCVRVLEL
ncbi:hypothetical protein J3R30DRAFT_850244 [Lentinula aciculospora]|uniref:F-box domain-containing protein n=1 Tax=Lentinula aciculospora TaxID=153920 RepID=A0A9W9APS0_9AGAR|nr:hypothetical protein J3R30DRAFT_850244 [Lentinula aciculospora]